MPDVDNLAAARRPDVQMVLHVRDTRSGHVIDTTQLQRFRVGVMQIEHEALGKSLF
jgi:hypothetical protein